jgi:3D (Asp-Asp-Asp) domain-containing protein
MPDRHAAVLGPTANPRYQLRATGYNSHESQTDSTPDITSTGARTTFGVIAASRDLLGDDLPYGSLVRIKDLGAFHTGNGVGAFQSLLDSQQLFIVEDTMHPRKQGQIDVWFEEYRTAVNWGVRKVEVELVRYGRHGAELLPPQASEFDASPIILASR